MPPIDQVSSIQELIFFIFFFIGLAIFKILTYLMPKTTKAVAFYYKTEINRETNEKLAETNLKLDELAKDLEVLTKIKEIQIYRNNKHTIEGELLVIKEAVKNDDQLLLAEIRKSILNEK